METPEIRDHLRQALEALREAKAVLSAGDQAAHIGLVHTNAGERVTLAMQRLRRLDDALVAETEELAETPTEAETEAPVATPRARKAGGAW